jgi:hypothetical protein
VEKEDDNDEDGGGGGGAIYSCRRLSSGRDLSLLCVIAALLPLYFSLRLETCSIINCLRL